MSPLEAHVRAYLDEGKAMQIATVQGGKPWCCTVYYVHDEDLNLYWISAKDRRHSQDIEADASVAGTIVASAYAESQKPRGLQFEGVARQTFGQERVRARELYIEKYQRPKDYHQEVLDDPDAAANWYVIQPSQIVLFDKVNYPDDPRQVWNLA